jgi:hypothetical protein
VSVSVFVCVNSCEHVYAYKISSVLMVAYGSYLVFGICDDIYYSVFVVVSLLLLSRRMWIVSIKFSQLTT